MSDLDELREYIEQAETANSRITCAQAIHGLAYSTLKDFVLAYDDGPNPE